MNECTGRLISNHRGQKGSRQLIGDLTSVEPDDFEMETANAAGISIIAKRT